MSVIDSDYDAYSVVAAECYLAKGVTLVYFVELGGLDCIVVDSSLDCKAKTLEESTLGRFCEGDLISSCV